MSSQPDCGGGSPLSHSGLVQAGKEIFFFLSGVEGCGRSNFAKMKAAFYEAVRQANANVVFDIPPEHIGQRGYSWAIGLSESHVHIRVFPREGLISVDAFTCGTADPEKMIEPLTTFFEASSSDVKRFLRGFKTGTAEQSIVPSYIDKTPGNVSFRPDLTERAILLDFYKAKKEILGDKEAMEKLFLAATGQKGAMKTHVFGEGGGITTTFRHSGFFLSIHTWPETWSASVTLSTTGAQNLNALVAKLTKGLGAHDVRRRDVTQYLKFQPLSLVA